MYYKNKTSKLSSVLYNSIFSLRRLMLVLFLFFLEESGFWLILAFNLIQTVYFIYISNVAPHAVPMYNKLEYQNELCIFAMQYMALCFLLNANM